MLTTLLSLTLWCNCFFGTATAQQSPSLGDKNSIITKFQDDIDFRSNVCHREKLFFHNEIGLSDALRGLNLTVVMHNYEFENSFFSLTADGKLDTEDPGLFPTILDELSRRAGFTWRDSFAVLPPLDPVDDKGKTWSDLLEWEINRFDISMDYWSHSVDRIAKGISFPEGYYDSSIILVENVDPHQNRSSIFSIWSFATPFEPIVWLYIFLSVLFTGILYMILERLNDESDERSLDHSPLATIFFSAITFTGHFDFRPQTNAARLMTFSWSFWALIVVSAYTANLASFLVARQSPAFRIKSIDHAVALEVPVCVKARTQGDEFLTAKYPNINLVRLGTEEETILGLVDGKCVATAMETSSFLIYERSKTINEKCSLQWEGGVVHSIQAGLATQIDTGTLCSSLISYSIDYHMKQMKADGFIDRVWYQYYEKIGDRHCIANLDSPAVDGETESLSMIDLGGIFVLHISLSVAALAMALFQFFCMKKKDAGEMMNRLSIRSNNTARNNAWDDCEDNMTVGGNSNCSLPGNRANRLRHRSIRSIRSITIGAPSAGTTEHTSTSTSTWTKQTDRAMMDQPDSNYSDQYPTSRIDRTLDTSYQGSSNYDYSAHGSTRRSTSNHRYREKSIYLDEVDLEKGLYGHVSSLNDRFDLEEESGVGSSGNVEENHNDQMMPETSSRRFFRTTSDGTLGATPLS